MHSDWALLRLNKRMPVSRSLEIQTVETPLDRQTPLVMAGYSRDSGLGNGGGALTYDSNCRIISSSTRLTETDCQAYKGASGGAVVALKDDGTPMLYGVISAGDSEGLSRYIPIGVISSALKIHLPVALTADM